MIGFSPEDYFAAQRSQYGMYNRAMPNYYKYLKVMARRITGLATLLKNEGFKEEKEWRFYTFKEYSMIGIGYYYEYARPLPFTTKFREGKNNLIPYIEVPLVINLPEALKNILFDEIVIGPNQDIDLAERSLYAYLGKRAKKITISKIPYINR